MNGCCDSLKRQSRQPFLRVLMTLLVEISCESYPKSWYFQNDLILLWYMHFNNESYVYIYIYTYLSLQNDLPIWGSHPEQIKAKPIARNGEIRWSETPLQHWLHRGGPGVSPFWGEAATSPKLTRDAWSHPNIAVQGRCRALPLMGSWCNHQKIKNMARKQCFGMKHRGTFLTLTEMDVQWLCWLWTYMM